MEVEKETAPLEFPLSNLPNNRISNLLLFRRSNVTSTMRSNHKGLNKLAMDSLEKSTFSHPVKVTMLPVARMKGRLEPLVHIARLVLDRDQTGNHSQELQTPRLMCKTQL